MWKPYALSRALSILQKQGTQEGWKGALEDEGREANRVPWSCPVVVHRLPLVGSVWQANQEAGTLESPAAVHWLRLIVVDGRRLQA